MVTVAFDVLGTCFTFTPLIEELAKQFNIPSLSAARTFFYMHFYASQRDFTYASISGSYTSIATIIKNTWPRSFYLAGIPFDEEKIDHVSKLLASLPPEEGLKEAFSLLKDHDVIAVTNGARASTAKLFEMQEISIQKIVSCDDQQQAKPLFSVYQQTIKLSSDDNDKWFVAAHAWDLQAARKAGFKTAFIATEEGPSPNELIYGKFDVYADTLDDAARQILQLI